MHQAVDDAGQAGVGDARDRHAGVGGEVAEVLAHLDRAGGAVDADDVGLQRVDGGQGGGDLRARQHAAGELDGDLHLQRHLAAVGPHGPAGAVDGRLDRQEVEEGLDDEQVGAALDEAVGLDLVLVAHLGVADLAEGGELGAGTDRAGDPAGPVGRRVAGGDLLGDAGGGHVQLVGPVGDAVLGERQPEAAEAVGLDDLAADVEVGGVEPRDELGPGDHEQLVAALEVGAAEVVGGEAGGLDAGAHGAVVDDDPFTGGVEEVAHGWFSWRVEDGWHLRRKLGPSRPIHQDSSGADRLPEALWGPSRVNWWWPVVRPGRRHRCRPGPRPLRSTGGPDAPTPRRTRRPRPR